MVDDPIPRDVADFIMRHIDSVAQLEALLLLRANPHETWGANTTSKRLYTAEQEILEVLARLCEDGLLSCTEGVYRYDCASEQLRDIVDRLAGIYSQHLIPVTNMIHAKPRRIRQFADAFKIRMDR
jgi:hypothetical protein